MRKISALRFLGSSLVEDLPPSSKAGADLRHKKKKTVPGPGGPQPPPIVAVNLTLTPPQTLRDHGVGPKHSTVPPKIKFVEFYDFIIFY